MYCIVWASSATKEFTKDELIELLKIGRRNNTKIGITGMLLYKNGNFLQALEGEREVVEVLFKKISQDSRHRGVLVLRKGEVPQRQFSEWSMGFQNLSSDDIIDVPGYSDFLNISFVGPELNSNPSAAYKLLLMFKKNMR